MTSSFTDPEHPNSLEELGVVNLGTPTPLFPGVARQKNSSA